MDSPGIHRFLHRATVLVWVSACLACGEASTSAPPAPAQAEAAALPSPPAPSGAASAQAAPAETTPPESDSEGTEDGPKPPPLTPVGVPECDKFVERFVACVERRVPPEQREDKMRELNTHRARWRELLSMQDGKIAAGLACRGVAQRLKSDLIVDYGCEF